MENENIETSNGYQAEPMIKKSQTTQTEDPKEEAHGELAQPEPTKESAVHEVEELKDELHELKDKYVRLLAEIDNLKKRAVKEKADAHKFANERLIQDMLPVLDSLEKAFLGIEEKALEDPVWQGFGMVQKQLIQVLEKAGLAVVESSQEAPFDPNVHQAIQRLEQEGIEKEQVHQEFAKGYLLNGRLLRPAMVSVALPKESKEQDLESSSES